MRKLVNFIYFTMMHIFIYHKDVKISGRQLKDIFLRLFNCMTSRVTVSPHSIDSDFISLKNVRREGAAGKILISKLAMVQFCS